LYLLFGEKMKIEYSKKLQQLPPYLFLEIDILKKKMLEKEKDIIDLSVGDPDIATPGFIIDRAREAVADAKNHRYPFGSGMTQLKEAIAKWYRSRFNVTIDHEEEVLVLIGSKEGIGHIPLAFVDNGDTVLVPDPAYPVYNASTILAGGVPYHMPLLAENDFLPDLDDIHHQTVREAKLMFLNYPNNPTAAVAGEEFYQQAVKFAAANNIIIAHDAAYSEIAYESYRPMSFLQVPGAMEVGVEFHSLSKTFNMTGWRIGFVVGNRNIIKGLARVKSNIDSGAFRAVQCAATVALESGTGHLEQQTLVYQERRDIIVNGLNELGWHITKPQATFYVWVPVPPGRTSREMALWLLEKTQIIVTPGNGFGRYGEGYIRVSLTSPTVRIKEAITRLKDEGVHKSRF